MYDRFRNTYSFTKDGKKIVLAPLSPQQVLKDQLTIEKEKKESLFATKGELEKDLSNSSPILLLIVKEGTSNELISFPSSSLYSLLVNKIT